MKTADTLPKQQVQAFQLPVHISYFLQNCKKSKPTKKDLPLLKTISQQLKATFRFKIHCSNMQFSPKNWDG